MEFKSFRQWIVVASCLFLLDACAKKQVDVVKVSSDEAVLASSSFFPGEAAAPIAAQTQNREAVTGGETGTIGGPAGTNGNNDGGAIPAPGSGSTSGGSSSGTSSGGSSSGSTGGSSSNSTPSGSGSSSTGSSPGSTSGSGSGSSAGSASNGSTTTPPSGNDTGSIANGGSGTGNDGGGVIPPSTGGANPTDPNGGGSNSGGNSGTTASNGTGSDSSSSGSSSGTSSNTPPSGTDAGGNNPAPSTQPSGNDGGSVANGGSNNGNDGGNTIPGSNGTGSSTPDGNSGSSTGSGTASNGSSGSSGSGGSASNPNDGNSGPSSNTPPSGNDGGSIANGSGTPNGNDTGSVPAGGTQPGNDGGSTATNPGSGSASNPGSDTPATGGSSGGDVASNTPGGGTSSNTPPSGNDGGAVNNGGGSTTGNDSGHTNPPGATPGNDGGGTSPGSGSSSGSGSSTGGSSNQGNNGVGNGQDSQPPGNPPVNDGAGTSPGHPGSSGGVADGGHLPNGGGTPSNDGGNSKPKTFIEVLKDIAEKLKTIIAGNHTTPSVPTPTPVPPSNGGGSATGGSNHGGSTSGGAVHYPPTPGTADNGHTCQSCNCSQSGTKVTLSRVCSVRRSGTNYLFFEDAVNPIVSVEATIYPEQSHSCSSAPQYAYAGYNYDYHDHASDQTLHVPLYAKKLNEVDLFQGRYSTSLNFSVAALKQAYPREWRNAMVTVKVCEDHNNDGKCSDETSQNTLSVTDVSFLADRVPNSMTLDVWNGRNLTLATDADLCEKQYSPVVLDLKGDGIQLSGPENGVQFDLNDSGQKVQTGWVAGNDDAFVVRDVNHNGRVDSGAELFGSATRLKNGQRAANGFEALKELDSNGDGFLDSRDKTWSDLRLWVDLNHNGKSEKGEILTLRSAKVNSLNLSYISMMEVDPFGNQTRQRSTFHEVVDGTTVSRLMIDVWFNTLVSQ